MKTERYNVSIIVPAYNEEASVSILHREIVNIMRSIDCVYEIIFVDDGSTDGTLAELKKLSPARIISFANNSGKSQALQAGFYEASGDYILTLDGDLQDDPSEIPRFINKAREGADLVCGWKKKRMDPVSKKIISKFANFVARKFSRVNIHDMNCGFKLYKSNVVKSLELYGDMHRYIPFIVSGMGFSVGEIPVNHRPRRYGKTKYGPGRLTRSLFDFFTLIFLRKFTDRPMHFFGFWGFLLSCVGFLSLFYLSWLKIVKETPIGNRPLLIFGILLVIIGFQFLSLGFLGELIIRRNKDRRQFNIREKIDNR